MRARVPSLLLASLLVVSACGGGGGSITKVDGASGSGSDADFDTALCSEFDESDGPSDKLIAGIPAEHQPAMEAIADFGRIFDDMGENDDTSLDQLVELLSRTGVADDLRKLAKFAEDQCGTTTGGDAAKKVAQIAEMASAPKVDDYCAALGKEFEQDSDGGPEQLAALADIAPEAHKAPLQRLADLDPAQVSEAEAEEVFAPLLGLGIYTEAVCGIDGSLAQMLLAVTFMGAGGDGTDGSGGTDGDGTIDGIDPTQYPDIGPDAVAAVNATVPAGAGITFSVTSADLEDDGQYLASMVVPDGWESETNFNVEYHPAGDSFGPTIEAGAGCDGVCGPNDWESRLRADGAIGQFMSNHPAAVERPLTGSDGVVLTDTSDGARALVLRWDDRAARYFSCDVTLDEPEDAALLDAFVDACLASRPSWFPVG